MKEKLLEDITSDNYLIRYESANNYLKANGIPHEISEIRRIFRKIITKKDRPDEAERKNFAEAKEMLVNYVKNYGKPIDYFSLSKDELNELLSEECHLTSPDIEKMKLMIKAGADINYRDEADFPIYATAFLKSNFELIKFFLEMGADVNVKSNGKSAWLRAIQFIKPEELTYLIEKGVDIHAELSTGENAVYILSEFHNTREKLKILLERGVNPNVADEYGRTPLHMAMKHDVAENAELLIEYGADVNCRDNEGNTPLLLAVNRESINCVNLLMKKGADANIPNTFNQYPYSLALERGFYKIAEIIFPGQGESEYRNSAAFQKVKQLKAEIIKALKQGRTYSTGDKEGYGLLKYENGVFRYTYQEHFSDSSYQSEYKTEEEVIDFLYSQFKWRLKNFSEVELYDSILNNIR